MKYKTKKKRMQVNTLATGFYEASLVAINPIEDTFKEKFSMNMFRTMPLYKVTSKDMVVQLYYKTKRGGVIGQSTHVLYRSPFMYNRYLAHDGSITDHLAPNKGRQHVRPLLAGEYNLIKVLDKMGHPHLPLHEMWNDNAQVNIFPESSTSQYVLYYISSLKDQCVSSMNAHHHGDFEPGTFSDSILENDSLIQGYYTVAPKLYRVDKRDRHVDVTYEILPDVPLLDQGLYMDEDIYRDYFK